MNGRKVKYLVEFIDSKGVGHVAIHSYDRLTGFVDMMKDFKFEDSVYPCTTIECTFNKKSKNHFARSK